MGGAISYKDIVIKMSSHSLLTALKKQFPDMDKRTDGSLLTFLRTDSRWKFIKELKYLPNLSDNFTFFVQFKQVTEVFHFDIDWSIGFSQKTCPRCPRATTEPYFPTI